METMPNATNMVLVATEYLRANLSVIPVKEDKTPIISWKKYAQNAMLEKEARYYFDKCNHIAVICGGVSGNLEVIDMDLKHDISGHLRKDFEGAVCAQNPDLLARLVIQSTVNKGIHYLYKCEKIESNQQLAKRYTTAEESEKQNTKVLIETRGEGGYVVVSPTPKYALIQGNLCDIPVISSIEREILLRTARIFNEVSNEIIKEDKTNLPTDLLSPWEDYNQRADVIALLQSHGWSVSWDKGERIALKRPGNTPTPYSAYYHKTLNLFSVFSTSTLFEISKGYKPAAVFAVLECGGDFSAAAIKLRNLGYGSSAMHPVVSPQLSFNEILLSSPYLPEKVYKTLPQVLQDACGKFTNRREKDCFFISALVVLGGSFHTLFSTYHKRTVYCNLFSFIVAPAANGKGVMVYAKTLAEGYNKQLQRESYEARKQYEMQLRTFNEAQKRKEVSLLEMPQKPPFKALFIPGDSSGASIKQLLAATEGSGIMFETEADTISNALKKDYGGYSDLLRKCFQHENISYARKVTEEYISIEKPKLAAAIAGTPNQMSNLIPSFEDGLFSRFIFYCFTNLYVWEDVSANDNDNLDFYFDKVAGVTAKWISYIQQQPFSFEFTGEQWQRFNQAFAVYLDKYTQEAGDVAASVVKRQGNISFRIAMILTALRYADEQLAQKTVFCAENHFQAILDLSDIFIQHKLLLVKQFSQEKPANHTHNNPSSPFIMRFLAALPPTFTRKEAVEIAKSMGFSSSAVDKYLTKLIPTYLQKSDTTYGMYVKVGN